MTLRPNMLDRRDIRARALAKARITWWRRGKPAVVFVDGYHVRIPWRKITAATE